MHTHTDITLLCVLYVYADHAHCAVLIIIMVSALRGQNHLTLVKIYIDGRY